MHGTLFAKCSGMATFDCNRCENTITVHAGITHKLNGKRVCTTCYYAALEAPVAPTPAHVARRSAPALPLPILEDGTSDESIPEAAKPRVCTTSDGLVEALRASLKPTPAWASKPAAVHAMARDLNVDALDAHERARARRMSR